MFKHSLTYHMLKRIAGLPADRLTFSPSGVIRCWFTTNWAATHQTPERLLDRMLELPAVEDGYVTTKGVVAIKIS